MPRNSQVETQRGARIEVPVSILFPVAVIAVLASPWLGFLLPRPVWREGSGRALALHALGAGLLALASGSLGWLLGPAALLPSLLWLWVAWARAAQGSRVHAAFALVGAQLGLLAAAPAFLPGAEGHHADDVGATFALAGWATGLAIGGTTLLAGLLPGAWRLLGALALPIAAWLGSVSMLLAFASWRETKWPEDLPEWARPAERAPSASPVATPSLPASLEPAPPLEPTAAAPDASEVDTVPASPEVAAAAVPRWIPDPELRSLHRERSALRDARDDEGTPALRDAFAAAAAAWGVASGHRVAALLVGQLDTDAEVELAAVLCPASEGPMRAFVRDATGDWELPFADTSTEATVQGEALNCEPGVTPHWWGLDGALMLGREGGYPEGAAMGWALRSDRPVVVLRHRFAGGMSGLSDWSDYDAMRWERATLEEQSAGALMWRGAMGEGALSTWVASGASTWTGPEDAAIEARVVPGEAGLALRVRIQDDRRLSADDLRRTDHLQLWTPQGGVAVRCGEPGPADTLSLAGAWNAKARAFASGGAPNDLRGARCEAEGVVLELPADVQEFALAYWDVDEGDAVSVLATSPGSPLSEPDAGGSYGSAAGWWGFVALVDDDRPTAMPVPPG